MIHSTRFGLLLTLIAIAVFGLFWAFLISRKEASKAEQQEKPNTTSSREVTPNDVPIVMMKPEDQQQNGVRTGLLQAISQKQALQATAVVLPIQDLISLRNEYVAANAQLEKARASLEVSRQEYERLNALYKDDRNASVRAVQAAQGAMQADRVAVRAAEDSIFLNQSNIRQQWGAIIANWLLSHSPEFDRIIRQKDVLVQITSSERSRGAIPASASLRTSQGKLLTARLVSPFPRLDTRIQSPSFLYMTASQPDLIPGLNLSALLPSGPVLQGVTVPASAVVWWEGKAWAYVQLSTTQFARREVPTEFPGDDGWFVPITTQGNSAFRPGEKLVVNGAQQVFSEEFRSQTQTIGEKD
jgi:hypothetical protein